MNAEQRRLEAGVELQFDGGRERLVAWHLARIVAAREA